MNLIQSLKFSQGHCSLAQAGQAKFAEFIGSTVNTSYVISLSQDSSNDGLELETSGKFKEKSLRERIFVKNIEESLGFIDLNLQTNFYHLVNFYIKQNIEEKKGLRKRLENIELEENIIQQLVSLEKLVIRERHSSVIVQALKAHIENVFPHLEVEIKTSYKQNQLAKPFFHIFSFSGREYQNYFLFVCSDTPIDQFTRDCCSLFLNSLEENVQLISRLNDLEEQNLDLRKIINLMPIPAILIDEEGEAIEASREFSKLDLLPRQCLEFKNQQVYRCGHGEFIVLKSESKREEDHFCFTYFLKSQNTGRLGSKSMREELGIIASSLAHEINNPLSGILAVVGLLELDIGPDDDRYAQLLEIKNSIKRCSELVRTFLGFSRFETDKGDSASVFDCVDQAFSLIRSRSIESDIVLDLRLDKSLKDSGLIFGKSIFSMIFYLILGEIITLRSHEKLLGGEVEKGEVLRGEVYQVNDTVYIEFENRLELSRDRLTVALLDHLLGIVSMDFSAESAKITLFKAV